MREDLEEPVPPRMPTVSPERMCRSIWDRASRSASAEYLKSTPSKSMEPSLTSITALSGLVMVLRSWRTSTIRWADSAEMVIITNTMDSIIKLTRI